jgi:A/G-specific adenine glycosylase
MKKSNSISDQLILWYDDNKRDLPWRNTSDAYSIWISEIILQQTRVIQGTNYYLRFIERFPTVYDLALADELEVLNYWQGLGYYSRARNLHKSAKIIVNEWDGKFPTLYGDVIKLPGIGRYTAAAICSFAFNQAYAVVDGNVYRVLSRVFGIETPIDGTKGQKEFAALAQELLLPNNSSVYNQAIMEFGALQCVPVSPDCIKCPLSNQCKAFIIKDVKNFPVKSKQPKVRKRYFNYLFFQVGDYTYLNKRMEKDVWKHLYEFPLIEEDSLVSVSNLISHTQTIRWIEGVNEITVLNVSPPIKHVLSHQIITSQLFTIRISNESEGLSSFLKLKISDINNFPVSRLMERFLETSQILSNG